MRTSFLADENFNNEILRTLKRHYPHVDVLRIQDCGLRGTDDPTILAFAAQEGRLLLSHDAKTLPSFAYDRVARGLSMPGVCLLRRDELILPAAEEIAMLEACSVPGEWEGQVIFLPLRTSPMK